MKSTWLIILLALALAFSLSACDSNDGPLEKAGESMDESMDEIGDKTEDAVDDLKDKAKKVTE